MKPPVFALYHLYSDSSAPPQMIYIGDDKALAFDALMAFGKKNYFDSNGLKMVECPAASPVSLEERLPDFSENRYNTSIARGSFLDPFPPME